MSVIATPASQRDEWEPEDDEFIAGEHTPTVYGDDDDEDYEPSRCSESSDDSHYERRRGARGVGRESERALVVRPWVT